ncbi:hypothetical protein DQM11_03840 [Leuconostoc pseudomesenteroides]|jgi:hypothetical protein|uniref:hypothetical protein n=1 Tax=Leuconostoc falkenbergense TaxID=2766470 RepID=UPI000E08E9FE|nr:hypothetical protein [Leuconostoc falkenbergense]MCT4411619.1 hypothetical protein [Leuconostoc falkenbergense]MDV3546670.1 hypothetical protein [Leuconostoc falkenbergense]RDG19276.1 hypothetical protein DQM11_03840 [Leuconostoc pseudomesenteroides]VTU61858.1 hypothetical protein AMBR_MGDJBKAP_01935 [Leuconostoc pseudomesenteroides]
MAVTNDDIMNEPRAVKHQHVWKQAKNVAKHFDVSVSTVKSWKNRGLITGYKHDGIIIYDVLVIERDLFQIEN